MRKKIFVNIDVKYCETAWIKGVSIMKYIILKNQFSFTKEQKLKGNQHKKKWW